MGCHPDNDYVYVAIPKGKELIPPQKMLGHDIPRLAALTNITRTEREMQCTGFAYKKCTIYMFTLCGSVSPFQVPVGLAQSRDAHFPKLP